MMVQCINCKRSHFYNKILGTHFIICECDKHVRREDVYIFGHCDRYDPKQEEFKNEFENEECDD